MGSPDNPIGRPAALYEKRKGVYPKKVDGPFRRFKWAVMGITLAIYYGTPWVRWDRGPYAPDQAVLVDLANRRFYMFQIEIWPHEFYYVAGLLIMAGIGLFLVTSAVGRAWCGYACPQTVWTDLFQHVDRLVDGDRNAQLRLANGPWTLEKIAKRSFKYAIYLVIAFWTGGAWIMYFADAPTLTAQFWTGQAAPVAYGTVAVLTATTFILGGFMREQVCIYMCPYARFQSAMFDRNTLIISYDPGRGEPRGSRRKGEDKKARGVGDCIDCTLCVQVCPTGIDIRDGLQYQCISCGACIDVCDTVMDKMNYPRGLVRYTTQNELEDGRPRRVWRPRIIVYSAILAGISIALVVAVFLRTPLEIDVLRDRQALYREAPGGRIEKVYTLKLLNMDTRAHRLRVSASGIDGLELQSDTRELTIASGEVIELPVVLRVERAQLKQRASTVTFALEAVDEPGLRKTEQARFLAPVP